MITSKTRTTSIFSYILEFGSVNLQVYSVFGCGEYTPLSWKTNYYLVDDLVKVLGNDLFDYKSKVNIYINSKKTNNFCVEHFNLLNILSENSSTTVDIDTVDRLCLLLIQQMPKSSLDLDFILK